MPAGHIQRVIQDATGWMPVGCEDVGMGAGHWHQCDECQEIAAVRRDIGQRVYSALIRYARTGSTEPPPDTEEPMPGPEGGIELHCANCGKPYRAIRMSSRTCSRACCTALHAKRKRLGQS